MELSPVQLIETDLVKVSVEYNAKTKSEEGHDHDDGNILLEHMKSIRRMKARPAEADGGKTALAYFVMLGLRSGEKQSENQPYTFEIVISGQIQVSVLNRPLEQVDDMAAKFGFTMLYSQIRETLLNITARMRHGEYMLPTMSFLQSTFPKEELASELGEP